MADLGVRKDYRGRGLARQLVKARLKSFSPGTTIVMRTSEQNQASQSLYKSLGFNFLPFTSEVLQKRQDGTTRSDTRIFMYKLLV